MDMSVLNATSALSASPAPASARAAETQYVTRRVLRYVENERMAGKVAVWDTVREAVSASQEAQKSLSAQADIAHSFEMALQAQSQEPKLDQNQNVPAFASPALVSSTPGLDVSDDLQESDVVEDAKEAENAENVDVSQIIYDEDDPDSFGFEDLIDIVNPLQHIPVVNQAYRAITGDTIKPALRVVGGALFTGGLGALFPLVDLVARHETGHSLQESVFSRAALRYEMKVDADTDADTDSAMQNTLLALSDRTYSGRTYNE